MTTEDQGEKIVHLARALLQQDRLENTQDDCHTFFSSIALKWWQRAAIALIAVAGTGAAGFMLAEYNRPLTRYEKVEIEALIYYAAHESDLPEQALHKDFLVRMNAASLDDLTHAQFEDGRNYLHNRIHKLP